MKKVLLATAAVLGFVGAASAADLRPLPARPLVVPVFNWTSCYIGGYVGGAWGAENVQAVDVNGYNFFPSDAWSYDTESSFLGGGTLGCNWQPIGSPFVLGIEGELGYLRLTGSAIDPFDGSAFSLASTTRIGDWYG
ncbi:MAG: outer membrane protein, partial [Rhodoplanes sp.]